ncbi:MAG: hypothetical protein PHR82_09570 [Endomicrobiaceae bacterium]|nr:hypothetical protein [Endomicrobiaceae bacterium]
MMNLIECCNSNQGFLLVILTAVYVLTTILILISNNKTTKIMLQSKEQDRILASIGTIKELSNISKDAPTTARECEIMKDNLCSFECLIAVLGGVDAYLAFVDFYNYLNELSKKYDPNIFQDIAFAKEFFKRKHKLESFFYSDSVAKMKIESKKKNFLKNMWSGKCKN